MFVAFYTGMIEKEEYGTPAYFSSHPQLSHELIEALVEMYAETVSTLMEGSPETEGNAVWEVVK